MKKALSSTFAAVAVTVLAAVAGGVPKAHASCDQVPAVSTQQEQKSGGADAALDAGLIVAGLAAIAVVRVSMKMN
jgi:hypothetical protein